MLVGVAIIAVTSVSEVRKNIGGNVSKAQKDSAIETWTLTKEDFKFILLFA